MISLDNFAQGVHGTALIAFMSSLTSASYTATQYAVLSSLYALLPKLLMGTSGWWWMHIGYPPFFLYTGVPEHSGAAALMCCRGAAISGRCVPQLRAARPRPARILR